MQLRTRMSEALSFARNNLAKARAGQKAQYDRSHREVHYDVGDLVLRRTHVLSDAVKGISASLSAKWSGPYRVGTKVTPLVYQLVDSKGRPTGGPVHVADLKPFVARCDDLEGGGNSQAADGNETGEGGPTSAHPPLRATEESELTFPPRRDSLGCMVGIPVAALRPGHTALQVVNTLCASIGSPVDPTLA